MSDASLNFGPDICAVLYWWVVISSFLEGLKNEKWVFILKNSNKVWLEMKIWLIEMKVWSEMLLSWVYVIMKERDLVCELFREDNATRHIFLIYHCQERTVADRKSVALYSKWCLIGQDRVTKHRFNSSGMENLEVELQALGRSRRSLISPCIDWAREYTSSQHVANHKGFVRAWGGETNVEYRL